jgi:GTP-binding protein
MFKDVAEVSLRAGDGGAGCVSFRREKYVPRGGPDGGTGGKGGDVVFVADPELTTLADVNLLPELRAGRGRAGEGNRRSGKQGDDLIVHVPVGTKIHDAEHGHVLRDLKEAGDSVAIVRGGAGGRGNACFARATRQVPRYAEPGGKGERRRVRLELSLVADVGLVGLPNAGKSTLLARLSAAHPRIADYPFTTLVPNLGVVRLDHARSFVVADIPGLIEGAAGGAGLGHRFLRHVERTRVLVHVVDAHPPDGTPAPVEAYRIVREELRAFSETLAAKEELVALNKVDAGPVDETLMSLRRETDREVCPVSAVTGNGLRELLVHVGRILFRDPD